MKIVPESKVLCLNWLRDDDSVKEEALELLKFFQHHCYHEGKMVVVRPVQVSEDNPFNSHVSFEVQQ